jgi:hypothetical protein
VVRYDPDESLPAEKSTESLDIDDLSVLEYPPDDPSRIAFRITPLEPAIPEQPPELPYQLLFGFASPALPQGTPHDLDPAAKGRGQLAEGGELETAPAALVA